MQLFNSWNSYNQNSVAVNIIVYNCYNFDSTVFLTLSASKEYFTAFFVRFKTYADSEISVTYPLLINGHLKEMILTS